MKKFLFLFLWMFGIGDLQSQTINAYEYWIDDNTGAKIFTSIAPVSAFHLQTDLPMTGVSFGFHTLNLRFIDNLNVWSSLLQQFFTKLPASSGSDKKIISYEYWIDDDYPSRTIQDVTPSSVYHMMDPLNLATVTAGFHTLNLRFKDSDNIWSSVLTQFFTRVPSSIAGEKKIVSYEYWVDDNYASKIVQDVAPSSVFHKMESLNLTTVSTGFHTMNLRFKDNAGGWSSVLSQFFTKNHEGCVVPNKIVSMGLWYDDDPSTMENYTLTPPVNVYHLMDTIETPFLTIGNHQVNYQFGDINKTFSVVRTDTFNITSCLPHGGRVISGLPSVCLGQTGVVYSIRNIKNADSYTWSVPAGATIMAGNNTNSITVDFSTAASPGDISVYATNACGDGTTMILPLTVYPATVAGVVTGGETIFFGMETNLTLEGNAGSVIKWQKRCNGGDWLDIANVTTTYTETPDTTGVCDYRAEVGSSPCSVLFSDITTVTVQPVTRTINLTLFLEGLFNPATNQMNKAQDEFGDKFPGTVADKIQLRLAKPTYPFSAYYSVKDVDLNQDGTCTVSIPRSGNYYLVIKHRNSIETWSSSPVSLLSDPVSYEFSTTSSQAFGDNMKEISGQWAIWGGDVNQDGIVDSGDMNPVENESMAVTMAYVPEDVNGDGIVDSGDMNIVENNSMAVIQVITP